MPILEHFIADIFPPILDIINDPNPGQIGTVKLFPEPEPVFEPILDPLLSSISTLTAILSANASFSRVFAIR